MLLAQLVDFLRDYEGHDPSIRAREAILEWALSNETPSDIAAAARSALASIPVGTPSPALRDFRAHLAHAARGLPEPRRRGGSAGRRNCLVQAA